MPKLVLIREGVYVSRIGSGKDQRVSPGTVLFIPPDERHWLHCQSKRGGSVFMFVSEPIATQGWSELPSAMTKLALPVVHAGENQEGLSAAFRSLIRLRTQTGPFEDALKSNLATQIWLQVAQLWERQADGQGEPARTTAMCRWLQKNLHKPITRDDLAARFNLSSAYVSQLFRREQGCGPIAYLRRLRMDLAQDLLQDGRYNVAEVGRRCGFEDPHYFSRVFRQEVGMPPSHCRCW